MIAMIEAGIEVDRYIAYEYDEETAKPEKGRPYGFAAFTASHNFPMIEQRGNVFAADFSEFEGFDYLIGGSPCTYWSIAQKNNRETEASGMGWELFCQYVRALHEAKPRFFVYENNKSMSKAIRESITNAFGFEPICINSALVSAQNRQRLYWVGKRNEDGTYSRVEINQPEDRGILLKGILDGATTDKEKAHCLKHQAGNIRDYFKKHHTQIAYEPVNMTADHKAQCIRSTCYKDGIRNLVGNNVDKRTAVAEPVCVAQRGRYNEDLKVEQHFEVRQDGKTNVLTTVQKDNNVCEPVRVGGLPRPNGELSNSQAMRVYSIDGKSVNLTSCGGGMGGKTGLYAIPVEFENEEPTKAISQNDGKTYNVYKVIDGQIYIKDKTYPIKLQNGYYIIRKLSVTECMRLQTVPEWYEFPVSDTQAYKMLGNGWTVSVISHLLSYTL